MIVAMGGPASGTRKLNEQRRATGFEAGEGADRCCGRRRSVAIAAAGDVEHVDRVAQEPDGEQRTVGQRRVPTPEDRAHRRNWACLDRTGPTSRRRVK